MSYSNNHYQFDLEEYQLLHRLENGQSSIDYNHAGWFYFLNKGDTDTAGRFFFRLVFNEPKSLSHRFEIARFLSLSKQRVAAIRWWHSALKMALKQPQTLKQDLAFIYLELGRLYQITNRAERFRRYLHLSINACPGYRPAMKLLEQSNPINHDRC